MSSTTRNERGGEYQTMKSSSISRSSYASDETTTPKTHSHRSSSAPKRASSSNSGVVEQSRSSHHHRKSAPSSPSSEELTYEDAVKKLDELSPKSKGILKSIIKTMNHQNGSENSPNSNHQNINNNNNTNNQQRLNTNNNNNNITTREQQNNKESTRTINNLKEIEKMATVNFANEPNRGAAVTEEKPSLRRTVSSIPEVTKPRRISSTKVVTLNVGGQLFQTTAKTLRACDLLFSSVFSEKDTVVRDDNGHVFIDRDPKYFRYILNYLREGKLVGKWNEINLDTLEKIIHEAKYFKLPGIINDIEECRVLNASFDPRTLEEECQLRFYNQEVVKKSESGSLFACLDYHFNKQLVECCNDPYRYFVKFLLRYGESSNLAIGVTCKQTNRWNRFEVMKRIKEKDTIAIWYNYQTEHLVLYWNDVEVQRKTFRINSNDWVFHVEMFADDNFCGLRLVQHQGIHPSQIEQEEEHDEEEEEEDQKP